MLFVFIAIASFCMAMWGKKVWSVLLIWGAFVLVINLWNYTHPGPDMVFAQEGGDEEWAIAYQAAPYWLQYGYTPETVSASDIINHNSSPLRDGVLSLIFGLLITSVFFIGVYCLYHT